MRRGAVALAVFPLAATALAIVATAVVGLDQRTALPPVIEARFYGFFLDRYPLYAFAIVYGLARIAALAAGATTNPVRCAAGGTIGALLLLALSDHPTFGGVVLRAGFATGGMTFLTYQPMPAAYAVGSAASALLFGLPFALTRLLVGGDGIGGRRRRLGLAAYRLGTGYLALWFAVAVIGLAHAAGFGPWPRRALSSTDAGIALSLVLVAFLPHAILVWLALRANPRHVSATA